MDSGMDASRLSIPRNSAEFFAIGPLTGRRTRGKTDPTEFGSTSNMSAF